MSNNSTIDGDKRVSTISATRKNNIYGTHLFIADLGIVTIWGLFMIRYSIWESSFLFLFLFLIRTILCFEMIGKSPWVLPSAITFAISYSAGIGKDWLLYPVRRIIYYTYCLVGQPEAGITLFKENTGQGRMVLVYVFTALLFLWLVFLPILIGIKENKLRDIHWKNKRLWCMIVVWCVVCIFLIYTDKRIGMILTGVLFSLIPVIYRSLCQSDSRSLVEMIFGDKYIRRYGITLLLVFLYLNIGNHNIFLSKTLGLFLLPPISYYLLCRWTGIRPVLTRYCISLGVAGVLYQSLISIPEAGKIMIISISFILTLYAAFPLFARNRIVTGIATIMLTFIGNPIILGFNPYILLASI